MGIKIRNPFKNPVAFIAQAALAPILAPAILAKEAAPGIMSGVGGLFGADSPESKERKAKEAAALAETQNRNSLYNSAISDNSIDAVSRRELLGLYQSGADSAKIAGLLSAARSGDGIYGVRKKNQSVMDQQQATPGSRQTLGYGSLL